MNYEDQRCENCYFSVVTDETDCDGSIKYSECHRFPPQISKNSWPGGSFPLVATFEWCGEWRQEDE